jgi:uncharacterized membrane protein
MLKRTKVITLLLTLVPAVYLALSWNDLPETVPVHFDLHGNPDRYGNKMELVGVTAAIIALNIIIYFLLTNIHRIDPRKKAIDNKERMSKISLAVSIFMSAILCLIIYSSIKGSFKLHTGLIYSLVGLLFAVIGNYMPNMKQNYFAGFRVPWTLDNEENWRKTHLLAGKLWFAGGLLIAVVCPFLQPEFSLVFFLVMIAILTIIPLTFSYKLFRKHKNLS